MLKKISITNYKGFKDEISFDFSEYKEYQFNEFAIKNDLIKSAIIYGKNGSGKSNFGLAIFDLTTHLIDKNKSHIQGTNYLNGDSDLDYAKFKYVFKLDDDFITYEYYKKAIDVLVYEELYVNEDKVFSYNFANHKGDFSGLDIIDAETLNTGQRMNMSVLRFITHNANISEDNIIFKLMEFINGMLWFRSTTDGNDYIGFQSGGEKLINSIIEADKVTDFQEFLKTKNLDYDLEVVKNEVGEENLIAKFAHKNYNFYQIASHGTRALLLYYFWSLKFSEASFVFIDEYDAFFHHALAKDLFLQLAKSIDTQLLITTHNTDLMSNNILRPDCYLLISDNKIKSLPNCTERELREGHNLAKILKSGGFDG